MGSCTRSSGMPGVGTPCIRGGTRGHRVGRGLAAGGPLAPMAESGCGRARERYTGPLLAEQTWDVVEEVTDGRA